MNQLETFAEILYNIRNGITDQRTGENRPYSVMDFYLEHKMSYRQFIAIAEERPAAETRDAKKFFQGYIPKEDELKDIRKIEFTVRGVKITDEEKEAIIQLLMDLGAPLSIKMFYCAVKSYSRGDILNDDEELKVSGR